VASESRTSSVRAILIVASNQVGESDARLASYEPTLRRILRFESYRLVGEDSSRIAVPGRGRISLGNGHSVDLDLEPGEGRSLRARVRWAGNNRTLINLGHTLAPGRPAVLAGPSTGKGDEVWGVIIVVE